MNIATMIAKAVLSCVCLIAAAILAYYSNSYAWMFVIMAIVCGA